MLEFLKGLFGDGQSMTYDELEAAVKSNGKIKAVDLSAGGYVSQDKFDSKVRAMSEQIETLNGQITQRNSDMAKLNESLEAAKADAGKLTGVQKSLAELQTKYDADKTAYEERLQQQSYEFAVRERVNGIQFTSNAARDAFTQAAIAKKFVQDGNTLVGYSDFEAEYRKADPGAFKAEEKPEEVRPGAIVHPTGASAAGNTNPFSFNFVGVRPHPTEK